MSKILITGNGFDLFHHLPTKYNHFMAIMKTVEKFEFKKEISFKDLFGRIFKDKFPVDYDLIIDNYKVNDIRFDYFKIKELDVLLKNNTWYKHFNKISEIETWIDFESEIENVLIQISSLIRLVEKKRTGEKFFKNDDLNIYIDFSEFDFCDKGVEGAVNIDDKYINIRTGKFDGKEVLRKMAFSLDEFTTIFNIYLSYIIMQFYDNFTGNLKIPIHFIDFFYSFNYTPSLEKLYIHNTNVVYLHGETNIDNSIQNIVLGVDEIPNEIVSNKAFEFSKYYQKIIKRTNNTLFEIPNKDTQISEENVFYVFGHSLDKSDKEYIENIFCFLEKDYTQTSGIVVFYYDENDNKSKVKNLFSFIKKDIIIDLNASGRLAFVEITKANLEREFSKKLWQKYGENYMV
ncbi:AbiH family protein [Flavobacterium sp. KS-LB2]|uniref:AbiH family protein n=1 Tax=Flavobacterium sp. KS-LB2 TaxID=3120525 RepID=UPI0030D55F39